MSIITKLSQDVTQYYKSITSPIGTNKRIQRDIQVRTVQRVLRVTEEKLKRRAGGLEG